MAVTIGETISSNNSSYSHTKRENFKKKYMKLTKRKYAFKEFANTYIMLKF